MKSLIYAVCRRTSGGMRSRARAYIQVILVWMTDACGTGTGPIENPNNQTEQPVITIIISRKNKKSHET